MFDLAAHGRNRAVGNGRLFPRHLKRIRNAFRADFGHRQFDIDDFLEFDCTAIIASRIDARPAVTLSVDFADQWLANRTKELMFSLLHVGEEVREVNNSSRVGVAKFNSPLCFENHKRVFWVEALWGRRVIQGRGRARKKNLPRQSVLAGLCLMHLAHANLSRL